MYDGIDDFIPTGVTMTGGKRVAIYARVSTADQTAENQMLDLRQHCARRGWTIVEEFTDVGISGAKKNRPALERLMGFVRRRRCDCVLVWRYDRFARSVSHLVSALEEFHQLGIDFASYDDEIDTTTPQGKFFFTVIAGFAELERSVIVDRIHAGLRRARASGRRLGRPGVSDEKVAEILSLRGTANVRQIAARVGVSKSVVAKVLSVNRGQNVADALDGARVAF